MALFTFDEGIQADALILAARAVLAETEQVASGALVQVQVLRKGTAPYSHLLPYRVAAYGRRMLNDCEGGEVAVSFFGQGKRVILFPDEVAYTAFIRALLAHAHAERRKLNRQIAKNNKLLAKYRKGGQQG